MALSFKCPRCGTDFDPYRRPRQELEGQALEGPPSPPGEYHWGGWKRRYDFARISAMLGRRSDTELAAVISAPVRNVTDIRRRLGIPPYRILVGFEHLAGKVSDAELARRAGCSVKGVRAWRKRHGVKRFPRGKSHADALLRQHLNDLEKLFGH